MAASDSTPLPIKNQAYRVYLPIFDADGDLVTGASGLDSEISKDGGAFADCTNEATEIGSSGIYYLDLTSTEMNADGVVVIVKTSTSGAKTTPIVMYPAESTDISVNVAAISGDTTAADNAELMFDGTGYAGGTTKLGVDIISISGDTTAADNAELMFDGTGYDASTSSIGLTSTTLNNIADAILKRDWTAVSGEASRSMLNALRFLRNKWSISGSTMTVTEEDDSTTAWTSALTTSGAANPVTGSDPT